MASERDVSDNKVPQPHDGAVMDSRVAVTLTAKEFCPMCDGRGWVRRILEGPSMSSNASVGCECLSPAAPTPPRRLPKDGECLLCDMGEDHLCPEPYPQTPDEDAAATLQREAPTPRDGR